MMEIATEDDEKEEYGEREEEKRGEMEEKGQNGVSSRRKEHTL